MRDLVNIFLRFDLGPARSQASCEVSWPKVALECIHNYTVECPVGWMLSNNECLAPST